MSGILCSMVGATYAVAVAEVIRRKKGITAVGNAQVDTAQSQFGGASALFDGTGDRLDITAAADLAFGSSDFTIECWVRYSSVSGNQSIIDFRDTAANGAYILLGNNGGAVYLYANGDYRIGNSGTQFAINTWYHVALSRSGTSTKLFINGTQSGSTYSDSNSYLGTSPDIGELNSSFGLTGFGTIGHIDEFRISNNARYTANFTSPTAPFVNDANTLLLLHMDGTDASTFFEDDNGVRSQKGITAVGNAQVDTAQSQFGGASALFDGTDDSLVANTSEALAGDFTMECWFRAANISAGYRAILVLGNEATGRFVLYMNGSQIGCNLYGVGTYDIVSNSAIAATTWYHITVVKNGSTQTLYLNGVSKGSVTAASSYGNTGGYYIGNLSTLSDDFNGHIDEVRISNSARYTTTFTPSTTAFVNDANTLLLIHADGTDASTTFTDDVGVRSPSGITAVGNAQVDTAQSKFGGASALFDGTGDYLDLYPRDTLMRWNDSNHTIETFVRINSFTGISAGSDLPVLYGLKFVDASGNYWSFGPISTGAVRFYYFNGSSQTLTTTGVTLTTNTWYHIAFVRNGTSIKIYVDGTERASGTVSGTPQYVADHPMTLGMYNNASFNGHIDEFRVSNTARYTAGFTPTTTPFQNDANTLLLLHCDGTDASTVFIDDNGTRPV